MAKSKPSNEGTQLVPMARHDLQGRSARVTKPATVKNPVRRTKRVYHMGNGLVSLLKTPPDLVSTVESNALESPLLRLPAELRTKIFQYALGGTRISPRQSRSLVDGHTTVTVDGILVSWHHRFTLPRVCRQLYHETATLVYSENHFHFDATDECRRF